MEEHTDTDRILVGVDGSPSSLDALRYAARLADAFDAPIEAVTTWSYPAFTVYQMVAEWSPEDDATAVLDQAIEDAFGDAPPDGLTRTIVCGPPAGTLIGMSASASMLILGSRGHGGFAGLLLGSVSAACAEHAHCPVLIMHGGSRNADEEKTVEMAEESTP